MIMTKWLLFTLRKCTVQIPEPWKEFDNVCFQLQIKMAISKYYDVGPLCLIIYKYTCFIYCFKVLFGEHFIFKNYLKMHQLVSDGNITCYFRQK